MEEIMEINESYKKGYADGFKDAQQNVRHGRWIVRAIGKGIHANHWAECSFCHVIGSPQWKVCPVCETRMDEESRKMSKEEIDFDYAAEDA